MDGFGRPLMKQRGSSRLYEEFGVKKQLLDDLYIRFIRLAEERIGLAAEYGVVSYISNSSYLTGRSHPLMRRSLLSSFDAVWVDNLNGDKYRTGKMIPKGLPGAGTRDDSAFTTEMDPRGIQPGTAIVTWIKRTGDATAPTGTVVSYRDFWGTAASKRQALIASLPSGTPSLHEAAPAYEGIQPNAEGRWRLSPRVIEGGFEAWPALDELFSDNFQAVNPSRGLDGSVVDTKKAALQTRMNAYFTASSFQSLSEAYPAFAIPRANYKPEEVWEEVRHPGFEAKRLRSYLTFPLDSRWIYYSEHPHLLDRHSPEFAKSKDKNEFMVTVPEPRKASEASPVFSTSLVGLHVHERGSVVFPRETVSDDLLAQRDANIAELAWRGAARPLRSNRRAQRGSRARFRRQAVPGRLRDASRAKLPVRA